MHEFTIKHTPNNFFTLYNDLLFYILMYKNNINVTRFETNLSNILNSYDYEYSWFYKNFNIYPNTILLLLNLIYTYNIDEYFARIIHLFHLLRS